MVRMDGGNAQPGLPFRCIRLLSDTEVFSLVPKLFLRTRQVVSSRVRESIFYLVTKGMFWALNKQDRDPNVVYPIKFFAPLELFFMDHRRP